MQSCIERYLTINSPCGESLCEGIYNITDVVGFTWNKAAGIAEGNFKESTGYQIAKKVRSIAAKTMMADFMAQLNIRGWATNLTAGSVRSGDFKTTVLPGSSIKRGVQIKAKDKCSYSGMKIKTISIKGGTDLNTTVYVQIDDIVYTFSVELLADKLYTLQNLCDSDGKNLFATDGATITIWIEDVNFKPYEVKPNCARCQAKTIICGEGKGWTKNGATVVESSSIAYGIIADIDCECDYDKIICALPNDEYKAQILKYAASIQFARMALETDRFNYFTIYGREELREYIAIAQNGYSKRINEYITSLRAYFMTNEFCQCVKCNGSTTKSLV
jgi:hypothetical protein